VGVIVAASASRRSNKVFADKAILDGTWLPPKVEIVA
jgi:hypothetical protein